MRLSNTLHYFAGRWFGTLTLALLVVTSCDDPAPKERILIENDVATLSARIQYRDEIIPLEALSVFQGKISYSGIDTILLTLVAEVTPPIHDGITLQATDVRIKGKKAYVSYNVRGETFLGGVDIFDIRDIRQPKLLSNILFTDSDVNGLVKSGNYLYLAVATEREEFSSPAVLERIKLSGDLLTDDIVSVDLPSYAATDVDVAGKWIYVTSGAAGGYVSILSIESLAKHDSVAMEDARGVDTDKNDVGVVAGTPARLITFDRELATVTNDYTLDGATIPFSKSTIKLRKKKAILALGDGGTQIVCLKDGSVIHREDQPQVAGLSSDVTVTNAASADKRLLFMGNGEAGVYVGTAQSNFNSKDCQVDDFKMVGKFRFDDLQSVNHVAFNNNVLFIASGLGGLKILTVEFNNDEEDNDDEDDDG